MGTKHGPNRLSNYQEVHTTRIRHLLDGGFLLRDGVQWEATGDGFITGEGLLICEGTIRIEVRKRLRILSDDGPNAIVQTVDFTYDAVLGGVGNILRYDSPHPTHNRFYHVHRFKTLEGDQDGTLEEIVGEANIPTLSEVIEEVRDWYYDNYEAIQSLNLRGFS